MGTTPVPIKKTSWLKKLGQDVVKVLAAVAGVEKVAEPVVEAFVPASSVVFNIFDYIVGLTTTAEQAFAAAGQQTSGAGKLAAVLPDVEQGLEQWITDNLPGSADVLKSEEWLSSKSTVATSIANSIVGFLNALPASSSTSVTATGSVAAAAVQAALKK
jgi:hypothetical protein